METTNEQKSDPTEDALKGVKESLEDVLGKMSPAMKLAQQAMEQFAPRSSKKAVVDGQMATITLTKNNTIMIEFDDRLYSESYYNNAQ